VHTSTVGVHGHVRRPPADEQAPFEPGDIYQETKAEAEALALRAHEERGLGVVVLRPGAIYGPGETRLLKLFRAIARGRYAIVGSGRPHYHLVYIDDLVRGFLLALERPEAVGEAFILAGPRSVSQAELAALIAKAAGGRVLPFRMPAAPLQWAGSLCEALCIPLGIEPPLHRRRVDFWTKNRSFSIEKARGLLGYEPLAGWL
jgi:nucleoside-diphosphate-sugar epimerase